jgi:hypothetical protein
MKTITKIEIIVAVLGVFCAVYVYGLVSQPQVVFGGAPSGLQATVSTTSPAAVGPQYAATIIATTTCAARIITTFAQPITLTFSDRGTTSTEMPGALYGHLQLGSTTVVYDAEQFGCGLVRAFGFGASTTITITNTK